MILIIKSLLIGIKKMFRYKFNTVTLLLYLHCQHSTSLNSGRHAERNFNDRGDM